jgi:hypothetical protein
MEAAKSILTLGLFTLILSYASISSVHADGKLWAVVVGVEGGGATHPDDDAQDFADVLMTIYGYPSDNIILLTNSEATKSAVISALEWVRDQERSQDGVSIFFSTHGSVDKLHLYDDFLLDMELSNILSEFDSQDILIVIDACYSGSFLDVAESISGGIIITASTADEVTYDIGFFGNTIFAEYFIDRGLSQGLADENGDGAVSIEEAFNYAYENCADPPGTLTATHPQLNHAYEYTESIELYVDKKTNEYGEVPWFSLITAGAVFSGVAYKKKDH